MSKFGALLQEGQMDLILGYLEKQPLSVNDPIKWGPGGKNISHPLHFLCDCVFEKYLSEDLALQIAKILLKKGANIDGLKIIGKDSPLIAACSLYTDQLGAYYLECKPDLYHHGIVHATCLHWAAWTGSNKMVKALLDKRMALEDASNEYKSTPLGWAINGAQNQNLRNKRNQLECVRLLLAAGASKKGISVDPNKWPELAAIFSNH